MKVPKVNLMTGEVMKEMTVEEYSLLSCDAEVRRKNEENVSINFV